MGTIFFFLRQYVPLRDQILIGELVKRFRSNERPKQLLTLQIAQAAQSGRVEEASSNVRALE